MLAANGDFIGDADIRGSSNASANGMMITRISPEVTIRFSKYIDFLPSHNQLSVTGLTETPSQNIIFGGRLMTDQISTYPNTMWLARIDSAGNLQQQKVYSGGEKVGNYFPVAAFNRYFSELLYYRLWFTFFYITSKYVFHTYPNFLPYHKQERSFKKQSCGYCCRCNLRGLKP